MPTFDKFLFVIEHIRRTHKLTALISLAALVVLISARIVKPKLRKRAPWITYIPEILIVVVIATSEHLSLPQIAGWLSCSAQS